jgi:hypothetical protein
MRLQLICVYSNSNIKKKSILEDVRISIIFICIKNILECFDFYRHLCSLLFTTFFRFCHIYIRSKFSLFGCSIPFTRFLWWKCPFPKSFYFIKIHWNNLKLFHFLKWIYFFNQIQIFLLHHFCQLAPSCISSYFSKVIQWGSILFSRNSSICFLVSFSAKKKKTFKSEWISILKFLFYLLITIYLSMNNSRIRYVFLSDLVLINLRQINEE